MVGIRRVLTKTGIDGIDVFYGLVGLAAHAAFTSWTSLIVRAIRGEEAEEDWRTLVSSGALIAAFTLASGARAREIAALRGAAVEMHAVVRQAAEDATLREERAVESDRRMTRLTKRLVLIAGLTLAAAVVTLIVSIVAIAQT